MRRAHTQTKPEHKKMGRKATAVLVVLMTMILLTAAGCARTANNGGQEREVPLHPAHPSTFMNSRELHAILAATPEPRPVSGRVVSGVVPHHLVAGSMIAEFFQILAGQSPELVILVGPNHENKGGRVITGLSDWQTPAGLMQTDKNVAGELLHTKLVVRDEEVLSREHSVGALMPLIRHFLPEARVVPLILHHDVTLAEVDKLLAALEPHLGGKTVLVASVDFSHYLTRKEAEAKDRFTLETMRNFDYPTLFRLGNDYLDSPASLAAAFRAAEARGIKEFQVLANTNSGILLGNDLIETTSYFTLTLCEE